MSMENKSVNSLILEWSKVLIMPIVLLIGGYFVNRSLNERVAETKFVELAVRILEEQPAPERQDLRKWAVAIIDKDSGVKLSPEAAEGLVKSTTIVRQSEKAVIDNASSRYEEFEDNQMRWDCEKFSRRVQMPNAGHLWASCDKYNETINPAPKGYFAFRSNQLRYECTKNRLTSYADRRNLFAMSQLCDELKSSNK